MADRDLAARPAVGDPGVAEEPGAGPPPEPETVDRERQESAGGSLAGEGGAEQLETGIEDGRMDRQAVRRLHQRLRHDHLSQGIAVHPPDRVKAEETWSVGAPRPEARRVGKKCVSTCR